MRNFRIGHRYDLNGTGIPVIATIIPKSKSVVVPGYLLRVGGNPECRVALVCSESYYGRELHTEGDTEFPLDDEQKDLVNKILEFQGI